MGFPIHIRAVMCYIEAHIHDGKINDGALEQAMGYSIAHIRDIFQKHTGCPLGRYVRTRKICCSAFELLYSQSSILDIALMYGFENHESYTRAFKKMTGMTPSQFRTKRPLSGKEELAVGVYGIGFLTKKERRSDMIMNTKRYEGNDSTILYGVPKVEYGAYNCGTPFPICLKAVLNYLGEDVTMDYTMVASGAAFRLAWNRTKWDLSNVDIYHTFEESNDVYRLGAEALGREFEFLGRSAKTEKEEFIRFIKKHIDEGYPCIALGIIGPPEACIITGYREDGNVLLGWNFFQNDPDFSSDVEIDESGYFISRKWWENTDTQAVMCMGSVAGEQMPKEQIIKNAVRALSAREEGNYSKGIAAYAAWREMLSENSHFHVKDNYSVLFEKLLCQNDAMQSLWDGRGKAAEYFRNEADVQKETGKEYREIADAFMETSKCAGQMISLLGSWDNMDGMLKNLADSDIRKQLCEQISAAERADTKALDKLKLVLQQK